MKRNIYVFVLLTFLMSGSMVSCSLIEQDPVQEINPDAFFANQRDSRAWMAGIYHSLQSTLNGGYFNWGEIRSDNFRNGEVSLSPELLLNALTANDPDTDALVSWENLYRTISLCNVVIEKYPDLITRNVDGGAATFRDQLGQAYAIRSLMYFYALRTWGGTPIVNAVITTPDQQLSYPRATVLEMKAQILSDIDNALLTIGGTTNNKYTIQRNGVFALKTDVHMWFQEYSEAIAASNNAIIGTSYITTPILWKDIFMNPTASTETIFSLFWDAEERGGGVSLGSNFGNGTTTARVRLEPAVADRLYNRRDPVTNKRLDARLWLSIDTVLYPTSAAFASTTGAKFGKFANFAPTGGFLYLAAGLSTTAIPIYRFADVMLLRAEALARTGSHQAALDIVNRIRSRVGYNVPARLVDYTGTPEQIGIAIQRTVLQERQLELLGEGKRWFDLCRIGKIYDYSLNGYDYLREVMNPLLASRAGATLFNTDVNMGRILFPIPQFIINANPLLRGKQNPPYSE